MMTKLLVVDDDRAMCDLVRDSLCKRRIDVEVVNDAKQALQAVHAADYDVVVTDLELGDMNGLELCERLVESRPDVPVVVLTAYGSLDTAIAALRVGAHDFLNKPLSMDALAHAVERSARHKQLSDEVRRLRDRESAPKLGELIGDSASMLQVYDMIRRVSPTDAYVLIHGESGTGKELVAQALHKGSSRAGAPFVAINCAAMPANLLESELFGHRKGAFTDARESRDGLFVKANGGTLFLDEIGEMPLEMQPKLLRVLQEHELRPIGSDETRSFDVRIIAATNRDLESDIEDGRFREDLFYRLNVVGIRMPPLRSRGRDILSLAQHFVDETAERLGKDVTGISPPAARKLLEYDWPGNVRELENTIERAVTLTTYAELVVDDLPEKVQKYQSKRLVISGQDPDEMPTLAEVERRYIERVLDSTGGNKTQAAKVLGLDRRTLYRKLDRFESS